MESQEFIGIKKASDKAVRSSAEAGWMDLDNQETETFNVRDIDNGDYRGYNLSGDETAFYRERYIEYTENEWYSFLIDYLTASLFADIKFMGPGKEAVDEFFNTICPDGLEEIAQAGLDAVRDGTGFLLKINDGESGQGNLKQLKYYPMWDMRMEWTNKRNPDFLQEGDEREDYDDEEAHPDEMRWIKVENTKTGQVWWYREYPRYDLVDYSMPELAMLRIKKSHLSPYGVPIGKSCFHAIKGLKGVNRDVLAAIKKVASSIMILKYNTSALNDSEKETKMANIAESLKGLASASADVVVLDDMHDIGYLSNLENHSGGYDGRLLNIMEHIEPVLSSVLLNFLVALGLVEQTGGNKSIIARQISEGKKVLDRYRNSVATFLRTQVIPDITDQEVDILFESKFDPEHVVMMCQSGIVSREWAQRQLDIVDEGTTYIEDINSAQNPSLESDSNDDEPSKKRRESQSDPVSRG